MELDELLMHQLFQATRIISYSLNRYFSPYNLHFSEWGIILVLMEKGPMIQRDLAGYMNVEPAAISRSLSGMERKGFIVREAGSDRRERKVSLAQETRAHYQEWNRIAREHRQAILANVDSEKQKKLCLLLKDICQAAERYDKKQVFLQRDER